MMVVALGAFNLGEGLEAALNFPKCWTGKRVERHGVKTAVAEPR